jgi:hypothetical protein
MSGKMRWAWYVAHVKELRNVNNILPENRKYNALLKDPAIGNIKMKYVKT